MAKILIINGSQRKKNTYGLLKRVQEEFIDDEIDFVNISEFEIKACTGCEQCLRKGDCHLKDDGQMILDKMVESDGIIIGTPIYLRQIPGLLKVIFDRGCAWYHRSPLVGKPIFFVTTTQVTGTKNAIKYLKDLSVQWGMVYAGKLNKTLFNLDKPFKSSIFNKFKKYLDHENLLTYRPSMKQIFEFHTQKVLAQEILPLDKIYWEEKGYVDKPYFFKCKIHLWTRFLGFLYYKFLSNIISKNKTV
ncbi:MAG: flavodoxin family protein [Acholeplasmataceae bacterium]|nr:flavodoxin family protein [Acholeplasmataceae bacterium]